MYILLERDIFCKLETKHILKKTWLFDKNAGDFCIHWIYIIFQYKCF